MFNRSDTLSEAFSDLVCTRYAKLLVNVFRFWQVKSKDVALKKSMTTFFQVFRSGLLSPMFLLLLEHCSIKMPNLAQHFAI
jgi:hypothetical protein